MTYTDAVHRALRTLAVLATLSVVVFDGDQAIIAAQSESTERSFLIDDSGPNDPVRVMGFTVDGSTLVPVPNFKTENGVVFSGVAIQANDLQWLKTSLIQIQNTISKTVDGVWITLYFPESNVATYVQVGSAERRLRQTKGENPGPDKSPFSLAQGQKLDIPLGANYDATRSLRDRQSPNASTICRVRIEMVFFADGTAWTQGSFLRPDPDKPGKFIRMCTPSPAGTSSADDQHGCRSHQSGI